MEKYQQSNEELCLAAQKGDFKAFDILLQNNYKIIRMTAYNLWSQQKTKNIRLGVTVDELFQIGCEGVWNCIPQYDPTQGAQFSTFAADCARNKMIDYLRKQKIMEQITHAMEQDRLTCYVGGIPADDPRNDPLNMIIQKETEKEFNEAFNKLCPREQAFFRSWTGMDNDDCFRSQRELSERHGISIREVRQLQQSTKQILLEDLESLWPSIQRCHRNLQIRLVDILRAEVYSKTQHEKGALIL